jgi:hypothetical protein
VSIAVPHKVITFAAADRASVTVLYSPDRSGQEIVPARISGLSQFRAFIFGNNISEFRSNCKINISTVSCAPLNYLAVPTAVLVQFTGLS